jgi:hypothetical protein
MGASYRVDRPTGIVVFQDDSLVEFSDWERTVLAALNDPATKGRRFLSDRRNLTQPHSLALIESIQGFFRIYSSRLGEGQWAVVGRPGSTQDAVDLAEDLLASTRIRVKSFPALKPALAWLLPVSDELELQRLAWWVDQRESMGA